MSLKNAGGVLCGGTIVNPFDEAFDREPLVGGKLLATHYAKDEAQFLAILEEF